MKQGIIYGGTFLFVFVIVTGLLIYLNSTYENVFQFNFAPKSTVMQSDSIKTDSLKVTENDVPIAQSDTTIAKDSVLLSSLEVVESKDSIDTNIIDNKKVKDQPVNSNHKSKNEIAEVNNLNNPKANLMSNQQLNTKPVIQTEAQKNEYSDWVKKVTSIYSSMEPRKAAKIIQTYSDNVARDILYNMNKKTAAKVVSEFSPETANRIFRFE